MRKRILIVEDEMIIAEDVKNILQNLDHEVIGIASNGEEALKLIRDNPPDLALMDIKINGPMNGIETTKRIQSLYDVPVIYMTAYADPDTVEQVKETQAYGFIVKPVNRQTIQGSVELAIYKHGMDRQLRNREERLEHLNQVLRAIRNVNQLITKETDRNRMIQGACDNLVETLGYQRAWIALYEHSARFGKFAFTSHADDFYLLRRHLIGTPSQYPPCVRLALKEYGLSVVDSSGHTCRNCPLRESDRNFSRFTMKLEYAGREFGVMSVAVPLLYQDDEEEQKLFIELVEDVAFALYKFDLEEAREKAETEIRSLSKFPSEDPDPVLRIDAEGRILYNNEAGQRIRQFMETPSSSRLKKKWRETIQSILQSNQIEQREVDIQDFTYSITFTPVQEFQYVNIYGLDITERKQNEVRLREDERRINSIFRAAPVGIGLLLNRVILNVNDRTCEITGYRTDELIGQNARMLYPTQAEYEFVGREKYRQIQKYNTGTVETQWQRKDGKILDILLSSTPLDPSDLSTGVTFTALDITERKLNERALAESEAHLAEAQQVAKIGSWEWDIPNNKSIWSDQTYRNFGLEPKSIPVNYDVYCSFIIEEDRPLEKAAGEQALYHKAPYNIDLRILKADGNPAVVNVQGKVFFDEEDKPVRMTGTVQDITERENVNEALRESEELYRQLFDAESDAIFLIENTTGQILAANQAASKMYGYEQDHILTMKNTDFSAEPDETRRVTESTPVIKDNVVKIPLRYHKKKDGTVFMVEIMGRFFEWRGKSVHIAAIRDVTDRQKVENTLRESEGNLQKAFEIAAIGQWKYAIKNDRYEWNQTALDVIGFPGDDIPLTWEACQKYIHPEDRAEIFQSIEKARTTRKVDVELRLIINNQTKWYKLRAHVEFDESGNDEATIGIIQDITEQEMAEAYIMRSEARYRELFNHMSSGVAVYQVMDGGKDFIFKDFNKAGERIDGQSRQSLMGKSIFAVRPDAEAFGLIDAFRKVLKTGQPVHHPVSFYHDERLTGWYENYIYLLPSGELVAVFDDVTEKKQAEEKLRSQNIFLETLLEAIPNPVFYKDVHLRYLGCNTAYARIAGVNPKALIGKTVEEVWPAECRKIQMRRDQELIRNPGKQRYEFQMKMTDGEEREFAIYKSTFPNSHGGVAGIVGVIFDITDQKQMERTIRESELKFRTLFENVPAMIVLHDMQGRILEANTRAIKKWGYPKKELLKMHVNDIDPDFIDRRDSEIYWKRLKRNTSIHFEARHRCRNGFVFPADMMLSKFMLNQQEVILAIGRDITQRKQSEMEVLKNQAELKRLSAQLIRTQEEERKHLSQELHDEMGQSLTGIKLNVASIQNELTEKNFPPVSELLTETDQLAENLLEKIHDIALNLRPNMLDDLGLVPAVKWLVAHNRKHWGIHIRLQFSGLPQRLNSEIETAIYRIVQESLNNILKHAGAKTVLIQIKMLKSGKLRLRITDDGCGFDLEKVEQQDPSSRGIGILGMQERTSNLGGTITIQSEPKKGTSIQVELPSARQDGPGGKQF